VIEPAVVDETDTQGIEINQCERFLPLFLNRRTFQLWMLLDE
jgi:hypothetical protein